MWIVLRRKTKGGICCAPGQKSALPPYASGDALLRVAKRSVHTTKTQPEAFFFRRKRTNASRDVGRPRVHSGCRSPLFPIPRTRPRRFRTSFRGRSAFSFPVVQRTAPRSRLDAGFKPLSFFSPPLVVPARRRFSTKRRFIPPGERARVLVKASARARPQRTTRRFRRTSGRRRRSPRRPTEPPAPGASVSARLLAARRFARVRVGSRVGKRAA